MASITTCTNSVITAISGYSYIAQLRYGSNGDSFGQPEANAGAPGNLLAGRTIWDDDPDDGIDSGSSPVSLCCEKGATGLKWGVNNSSFILAPVGAYRSIGYLKIRAAVMNQAAICWSNVGVAFFKGGTLVDAVTLGDFGPDETQVPGGSIKETIVTVTPAAGSLYDSVSVMGTVRLQAPQGVYPAENDLFGDILIYAK